MPSTLKKNCRLIVDSDNHYLAALKGNQPKLLAAVQQQFVPEQEYLDISKGHGRIERRLTQVWRHIETLPDWPGLCCVIRVHSTREQLFYDMNVVTRETRYYISSLDESAARIAVRIRGYWGAENNVHYVRDVTQDEDKSRIRTTPLVQNFALARNFALNLYRQFGFTNMAQALRRCSHTLTTLKAVFE
ncbi:MAG: ISAs1 family transposase [Cyanobacteria bacterium J06597_1]